MGGQGIGLEVGGESPGLETRLTGVIASHEQSDFNLQSI